jgi:alpha-L-fucosidase
MKELADACREAGLGFGFYSSHNQDWTEPGGSGGPGQNPDGSRADFAQYFREKCYPQVKEICTQYGPLSFVWFDTPGRIPKEFVQELVKFVREHQPSAMLCSRVGHGLGDYESQGDMEVPPRNAEGLWETCDTTNDSWAYAWYDQNWKDAKEILNRVVATVGRGGSYLLNVGPDGKGRIPAPATRYLIEAGQWIKKHSDVVYAAGPSPWGMALPWGDVTTSGDKLNLVVFDWPQNRQIHLSGIDADVVTAGLRTDDERLLPVPWTRKGGWMVLDAGGIPTAELSGPASVIEVRLNSAPTVDPTAGVHPNIPTTLLVEFADAKQATKKEIKWMEKFGEWKHVTQVGGWKEGGRATWTVDVAEPGEYYVDLTYKGEGRLVWRIETSGGAMLQNQQNSASVYHTYPFGLMRFGRAGRHTISVSLVDGNHDQASLSALVIRPAQ